MNLKLEKEYSTAPVLTEVDALKSQIDAMRPLPQDIEGRVMQKLRLDWNYNSNAIEGNKLNYGETTALLMHGITAKGKPLKDHLDIQGHNEAINFLLSIVREERPLSEADIRSLHAMILVEPYDVQAQTADGHPTTKRIDIGKYKTSPNHVQTATGETHYYTSPEETPLKMRELTEWYEIVNKDPEIHPVVTAALFHHRFTAIHPFDDGNGRMARILMNLILMQKGYPPVVIKNDDRQNYYALLSQADVGDSWPFIEYIAELLQSSLNLYMKGIRGEDIDEDEDIDKEIALFKMQIQSQATLKEKRNITSVRDVIATRIIPLINKVVSKAKQFDPLFFNIERSLNLYYEEVIFHRQVVSIDIKAGSFEIPPKVYDELEFRYTFSQFRNIENLFQVTASFFVGFEEHRFFLVDSDNNKIGFYTYDQPLTAEHQKDIVRSFISNIKTKMESKFTLKTKTPSDTDGV